ncbi:autotransporter assembly complex protein TamA [Thiorhodospira sibirica]|uniref:autotransporter assembly complex protein TamA n=1 Tax=Thiorhodospira sibirica TaxID=154347 RepID=UPI00022C5DDD
MRFSCQSAFRTISLVWASVVLCVFGASTLLAAEPTPVITIEGVSEAQEANIRAYLSLDRLGCTLTETQSRLAQRRAHNEVHDALRALGHYQPEIDLQWRTEETCWSLHLHIQPGPPVRIRSLRETVQITGAGVQEAPFRELLANLPMRTGDVLRHDQYEALKSAMTRIANTRGYFDARFIEQSLRVDRQALTADIVLHFDTGARYQFGEIELQQDSLRPELAGKFIPFKPGDAYDSRDLIALQQGLLDSGYFDTVRVNADPQSAENRVIPVVVEFTPRPRWVYLAGVGASTDTGPRLRLGLENRRANRAGHRYETDLELSPVRSSLGLNYEIPMDDPRRERINLSARFKTEDTDTSKSDLWQFGAAHVREYPSGWIKTQALSFEREDFTIGGLTRRTDLLMPVLGLQRTRSDHPVFPSRGWRVNTSVRGASEEVVSSVSFLQWQGRAKVIEPLGPGRVIARLDSGTTWVDEFSELPGSVRFFAGGDTSVRGYAYQSLGPSNKDGRIIGGRHLLAGSLEYEYPLVKDFSAAVFVDGGNAFERLDEFDARYGVGAGIRWRSPIGPIRIDIAHPTDSTDHFRLHLSMGADL